MKKSISTAITLLAFTTLLSLSIPTYGLDYEIAKPKPYRLQMVDPSRISLIPDQSDTCANATKVSAVREPASGYYVAKILANIGGAGDVDWFFIDLPYAWTLVGVGTTGGTDTFGEMTWGCGQKMIGWDDNSGIDNNFTMTTIGGGKLFIKVRHSNPSGTGAYTFNIVYKLLI